MNEVIRFDIYFRGGVPEVLPSLDGRYMRFEDHEKASLPVAELIAACEPFGRHNSSEETFSAPHIAKADVDRLRAALARIRSEQS